MAVLHATASGVAKSSAMVPGKGLIFGPLIPCTPSVLVTPKVLFSITFRGFLPAVTKSLIPGVI